MSWIEKNKRNWRAAILILLLLALIGPWGFDRVNVPAEYTCDPPHIRLEGDFCGFPISGVSSISMIIGEVFHTGTLIMTGASSQGYLDDWRILFATLILILLLLPICNLLYMILRGDRPRIQKFQLVICALDLSLLLILALANSPRFFYALWGLWLYIVLLAIILILEGMLRRANATGPG